MNEASDEASEPGGESWVLLKALGDWAYKNSPVALSILGAIGYVALRASYSRFYGLLGTTPEEVGFTSSKVLVQSVGSVMMVLTFAALAVALFLPALVIAAPPPQSQSAENDWPARVPTYIRKVDKFVNTLSALMQMVIVPLVALIALLTLWIFLVPIVPNRWRVLTAFGLPLFFIVVNGGVLAVTALDRRWRRKAGEPDRPEDRSFLKTPVDLKRFAFLLPTAGLIAAVSLPIFLPLTAAKLASSVTNGAAIPPNSYLMGPFSLLGVYAKPVRVAPATGTATPAPLDLQNRKCLLYLGRSEGTVTLYDSERDESVQAPSAEMVISTHKEDPSCRKTVPR